MNKKRAYRLLVLFFLMFASILQAQEKEFTVDNVPNVRLKNKLQYAVNPAGLLSQAACDSIDRMLAALEQQTGIEVSVVVLPSIGEEVCKNVAHQLLNKWGVGKKDKNNGLMILLVTDQRCIEFETGYGLEGDLPDAICKRIQVKEMIPYLKNGNWSEGMVAGVQAVCARLDGTMVNERNGKGSNEYFLILFLAILGFIAVSAISGYMALRKASQCPSCKKHELQRESSILISQNSNSKTERVSYKCRNCGHVVSRNVTTYTNSNHGSGGVGPMAGGSFGGALGSGRGGGGFSGGSFGGGMSGGGGAGSRF